MDARRAALGFADEAEMQAALQRRAMVEEAFELREAGVDPNTVSDALVLGLKGEEGFTLRDAALFALSVAPVTGNAMAAHASVEAGQTLLDAIDAEDWDTAQEAGIALGIEIFGLLPGIGGALSKAAKAAKAARTGKKGDGPGNEAGGPSSSLLTRSIENVRGRYHAATGTWTTLKARHQLAEAYKLEEAFQDSKAKDLTKITGDELLDSPTWKGLSDAERKSVTGSLKNAVSQGMEENIEKLLSEAGFTLPKVNAFDLKYEVPHSSTSAKRVYDTVTEEDLDLVNDMLIVPGATPPRQRNRYRSESRRCCKE